MPGYHVTGEIARGGMGRVLAARDPAFGREVAVKVLLRPGADAARLFAREAYLTGRLTHPGIPPAYHLGTLADGSPFLAMKLVRGRTLSALLKERPTPAHDLPRFVGVFEQVCQAVGFAHAEGVVHRDLKPANVMVGAFGEVQVMDWGLAFEAGPGAEAAGAMGTPAYMAPEQARGEPVDARADVFALGGVLCEVLTGRRPFPGKTGPEALRQAVAGDVADALGRLDGCGADRELIDLAKRCLSPARDARPADGTAVAAEVTAYRAGVEERLRTAERERAAAEARAAEQRKRRRAQLALAAAVGLLLSGGAGFGWWADHQTNERRLDRERADGLLKAEQVAFDAERKLKGEQAGERVQSLLALAAEARKEYRYKAAEDSLREAAELAAGLAPTAGNAVRQARTDLAFVRELDAIRMKRSTWVRTTVEAAGKSGDTNKTLNGPAPAAAPIPLSGVAGFDKTRVPAEYRTAFTARGLDVVTDPDGIGRRIAAMDIRIELVTALDDWAVLEKDDVVRDLVLRVARQADPNLEAIPFRDPTVWGDKVRFKELTTRADPSRLSPGLVVAVAELMSGQGLDPAPLLRRAISFYPREFLFYFTLGQARLDRGGFKDPEEVVGAYRAARAIRPDNITLLTNLGNALRDRGDLAGAVATSREAVRINPTIAQPHHNLGNALMLQGYLDAADAEYREAIRLDARYAAPHDGLAGILRKKGDLAGALASSREALRLDPEFSNFYVTRGMILHDMKDLPGAAAAHREAIRFDPKSAIAHYHLGRVLEDQRDPAAAEVEHREAIRLDPAFHFSHDKLAILMALKGSSREAVVSHREAVRLDPTNAIYHYNLARTLYDSRDLVEAVAEYREAARLRPGYASAHFAVGVILMNRAGPGELDAAAAEYRTAIKADPKFAFAHQNLGVTLNKQGDAAGAEAAWRAAAAADPAYARPHNSLGELYEARLDLDRAATEYREAIRLNPSYANPHTNLGDVYRKWGRPAEAVAEYRAALAIQPDIAYTRTMLAYCERVLRGEVPRAPPPRPVER